MLADVAAVPPQGMDPASGRYRYIDGMRGVAALSVVYFHIALGALSGPVPVGVVERTVFFLTTSIFDLGKIAVVLFFAISGYVIPFSLLRKGKGVKISFVIGRFFRLYPAYWLSIAGAALFLFHMAGVELPTKMLLANISMLQSFVRQPDMNGVYWTLQIELIFYALCFGLNLKDWLGKPRVIVGISAVMLVLAILTAVVRYKTGMKLPVALPLALAVMYFGMMWRLFESERSSEFRKIVIGYLVAFAIIIPLVSMLAYSVDYGFHETWYRYTITYYTAILGFVVFSTVLRSQSALLGYLGTISYSVYLFGPIVQVAVARAIPGLTSGALPVHVFILAVMLATIAVASLVYHLVEAPSIALGKAIALRLTHRMHVPTATPFEAPL